MTFKISVVTELKTIYKRMTLNMLKILGLIPNQALWMYYKLDL